MWIIGIIGDIAAGKSSVAARLETLGATWIDADKIARRALDDIALRPQLVARFGADCVNSDGKVDRQVIAASVFGDAPAAAANLDYLESLIHPWVRKTIRGQLIALATSQTASKEALPPAVVLDIPLLIESNWEMVCDEVWCVTADLDVRRRRALGRGWDEGELERRTAQQLPAAVKRHHSHLVLQNDLNRADLHAKVDSEFQSRRSQTKKIEATDHCWGRDWPPIV